MITLLLIFLPARHNTFLASEKGQPLAFSLTMLQHQMLIGSHSAPTRTTTFSWTFLRRFDFRKLQQEIKSSLCGDLHAQCCCSTCSKIQFFQRQKVQMMALMVSGYGRNEILVAWCLTLGNRFHSYRCW